LVTPGPDADVGVKDETKSESTFGASPLRIYSDVIVAAIVRWK
jgi:hypothetical protein